MAIKISYSEKCTNIASLLIDGDYTWSQASMSAEIQGVDFDDVKDSYGRLYEAEQCANEGYIHD